MNEDRLDTGDANSPSATVSLQKDAANRGPGGTEPALTENRPTPLPASVPGYEILEELGRGGMGVVYKARHKTLQRMVALKMIRGGASAGPEELQRFRTEAEAIAHLQHANIVQIFEVGESDSLPFFSMEYCPNGSLAAWHRAVAFLPERRARSVHKLALAPAAAHAAGIVHRDLKPQNVLLAADGTPKVSDFGLAKRLAQGGPEGLSGLTQTGAILGTPSYMAPEQAFGESKHVGPESDAYACGDLVHVARWPTPLRGADAAGHLAPGGERGSSAVRHPSSGRAQ